MFLNLIVNAAHAIAETKRADGLIRVVSRCDVAAVTVIIGDNGGGTPLKIQRQVFHRSSAAVRRDLRAELLGEGGADTRFKMPHPIECDLATPGRGASCCLSEAECIVAAVRC